MNPKVNFLFFCMIFVGNFALAQKKLLKFAPDKDFYRIKSVAQKTGKTNTVLYFTRLNTIKPVAITIAGKPVINSSPFSYSLINPGFYTHNFGFFCKKELQFEKITKIPFKFRLGSVQQCDWMEGKPNAINPF
jgi:hypothetical protein